MVREGLQGYPRSMYRAVTAESAETWECAYCGKINEIPVWGTLRMCSRCQKEDPEPAN